MRKFLIMYAALVLTACSDLLSLLDTSETSDPTGAEMTEILENTCWGTSGAVIPKGYQEMNLFHVTLSEGEEYNESAVTDVIFKDNTITFVFPGGGWRSTAYTYDQESGLMKFDKPLIYGTPNFGGVDIYECRFVKVNLLGHPHVTLFDASVDDWQKVEIEKGQWRLSLAPMDERQNEKLHEMDCIYGTSYTPVTIEMEGGARWAYENVDSDRLFPLMKLDLGEIYYGLDYTMPTVAQARMLVENCYCLTHKSSKGEEYVLVGNEGGSIVLPKPSGPGEEMGFWLVGGSAFVYSYGDEKTVDGDFLCTMSILPAEETAGRMFCVRPVRK